MRVHSLHLKVFHPYFFPSGDRSHKKSKKDKGDKEGRKRKGRRDEKERKKYHREEKHRRQGKGMDQVRVREEGK